MSFFAQALALLVLLAAPAAHAGALVVMIGDSNTAGFVPGTITRTSTPRALRKLLELQDPHGFWYRAHVTNYGLFGTTTDDWLAPPSSFLCTNRAPRKLDPLLALACARGMVMADAVLPSLPKTPDAVLVVLGVNDAGGANDPDRTVDNLERIAAALRPAPVFIAPPFPSSLPERAGFVRDVRQRLLDRQLLSGPDWPPLPTRDGLHLTDGGFAAAAGLWIDVLVGSRP